MRILVISPSFFGYEQAIVDAFRARGHTVELVDDRPSNRPLKRALVRVAPWVMRRATDSHYRAAARREASGRFDGVLVVKGEVVPDWFLRDLRSSNPEAIFVYYTYDSVSNSPQGQRLLSHFDRRFSFDPVDVDSNPGFELMHLFFGASYRPSGEHRDLDISFVGTLHGDRYRLVQAISRDIPTGRKRLYFYMPARWYFWLRKLLSKDVRAVGRKEVSFRPLSTADVVSIAQRSRVVIDIQRHGQSGLTMRTFEALATGAALITTNDSVRNLPFYDEKSILIVPRDANRVDSTEVASFVNRQPTTALPPETIQPYSLDRWADRILNAFEMRGEAR